ncbi:MAG TPA: phosphatase PAP2 family protein [Longimicrobiales bacterium]
MSAPPAAHGLGLPLDRLFALYLAAAAPALAFGGRPAFWPVLLAAHALLIMVLWPLLPFGRAIDALPPARQRAIRTAADWAPLLLIPLLYKELAILNRAVHGGRYFDETVIAWEQAIFGGQPSSDWAAALPNLVLSEPLHAAYLSYYFIIFVPPLLLFMTGRHDVFRAGVFALMLAFFVHYLFFIYFPVQGPRYLFPSPAGELANGFFYQLAHRVLEVGSAQGAAFPSSHVGVSVAQTLVVWRFMPRLAPLFAVLTLGLALGAVYGGFHYATDALAGVLLGAAAFLAAPRVARQLTPDGR